MSFASRAASIGDVFGTTLWPVMRLAIKGFDVTLSYGLMATALFVMTQMGTTPGNLYLAMLFDLAVVLIVFGVWGIGIVSWMTDGESKPYRIYKAFPVPMSATLAITTYYIARFFAPEFVDAHLAWFLTGAVAAFILIDALLEIILEPGQKGVGKLQRMAQKVIIATGALALVATILLMVYGRLRAFGALEGTPMLDQAALFVFNDSFGWLMQYVER